MICTDSTVSTNYTVLFWHSCCVVVCIVSPHLTSFTGIHSQYSRFYCISTRLIVDRYGTYRRQRPFNNILQIANCPCSLGIYETHPQTQETSPKLMQLLNWLWPCPNSDCCPMFYRCNSPGPKFESMGAQGASQQSSSRHARLRYSMKLSCQSISFHLKLCANASAGTKECAESPTPVIEENHTSQVLVDIHTS